MPVTKQLGNRVFPGLPKQSHTQTAAAEMIPLVLLKTFLVFKILHLACGSTYIQLCHMCVWWQYVWPYLIRIFKHTCMLSKTPLRMDSAKLLKAPKVGMTLAHFLSLQGNRARGTSALGCAGASGW